MKNVLFLNLTAFSQTGGIEKFNRNFLKALYETEGETGIKSAAISLYDTDAADKYYPKAKYSGYSRRRVAFVLNSFFKALKYDVVILGHINLSLVGLMIKTFNPRKKVMLICHGIEVWRELPAIQKMLIQRVDKILAVSTYTKDKIVSLHGINADSVSVFHNTIDAYFSLPEKFEKNAGLMNRYGIDEGDVVLYTLCRLSYSEQYKGYDEVLTALPEIISKYPHVKYIIAGKYDEREKSRLDEIISKNNLSANVVFTGFVKDEEIIQHYQLADAYVMPSKGEGFGIVFIEAMACGVPVIAGNKDGSTDAMQTPGSGRLVNPESIEEIVSAIEWVIKNKATRPEEASKQLQRNVMQRFGFNNYKHKLQEQLSLL